MQSDQTRLNYFIPSDNTGKTFSPIYSQFVSVIKAKVHFLTNNNSPISFYLRCNSMKMKNKTNNLKIKNNEKILKMNIYFPSYFK